MSTVLRPCLKPFLLLGRRSCSRWIVRRSNKILAKILPAIESREIHRWLLQSCRQPLPLYKCTIEASLKSCGSCPWAHMVPNSSVSFLVRSGHPAWGFATSKTSDGFGNLYSIWKIVKRIVGWNLWQTCNGFIIDGRRAIENSIEVLCPALKDLLLDQRLPISTEKRWWSWWGLAKDGSVGTIEIFQVITVSVCLNLIGLLAQLLVLHLKKLTLNQPLDVGEGSFCRGWCSV